MLQRLLCYMLVLLAAVQTASGQNPYLKAKSTAASGGPTILELAQMIADETSVMTVVTNSVSTAINAAGSPSSDSRALGKFWDGNVGPGTLLPINQPDPQNPTATYAGGIGIDRGVCLCTSVASDTDGSPSSERGLGVEGPNNGEPFVNPGEITTRLFKPIDADLVNSVFAGNSPGGGDATVLQFDVTVESPGFLRIGFVFGSDEYPAWILQQFNDSFAILIKKNVCGDGVFENIATLKEPGNPNALPFKLQTIAGCAQLFKKNQLAPSPPPFLASGHAIKNAQGQYDTSVPSFDHEFGGFTQKLTKETTYPLSPGTYRIKIVIQDIGTNPLEQDGQDRLVDSGLFIEEHSLKLFPLQHGDYNGDGVVDYDDYLVWEANIGTVPAHFYHGDGNGDCDVDSWDYDVWVEHYGETGNADLVADFNRDGCVDEADESIWTANFGLESCASRFEGDANGDGKVDAADYVIWRKLEGNCGGGSLALAGDNEDSTANIKARLPNSADMNGDGVVDGVDLPLLRAAVESAIDGAADGTDLTAPSDGPQPELTPAEFGP